MKEKERKDREIVHDILGAVTLGKLPPKMVLLLFIY